MASLMIIIIAADYECINYQRIAKNKTTLTFIENQAIIMSETNNTLRQRRSFLIRRSSPSQYGLLRRSSVRASFALSNSFQNILNEKKQSDKNKNNSYKQSLITNTIITKLSDIISNTIGDGGFRAAIFGLSDGLATNLCLITGIQFAIMNDEQQLNYGDIYDEIIRTGIAGIFGGAVSMALGEYISMSAQTEMIQSEIDKRKQLLDDDWMEQMDVLRVILSKTLQKDTIDKVMQDFQLAEPDDVLELDCKISMGIDPDEIENPFVSALWSFIMFSIGGFIPLSPYFIATTNVSLGAMVSVLLSLITSVVIGYAIGIMNDVSIVKTVSRQLIGTLCGVMCSMLINFFFNV